MRDCKCTTGIVNVGKAHTACRAEYEMSLFFFLSLMSSFLVTGHFFFLCTDILPFPFFASQDTAGQERFRALGPIYYRDANGAVLVFDIIDQDSFAKVQSWVKELRAMLDRDVPIMIVGNKVDLERNRKVKEEEARAYAETVGATYMETSVKLNRNVNETFLKIAQCTCLGRKGTQGPMGCLLRIQHARSGTVPYCRYCVAAPHILGCMLCVSCALFPSGLYCFIADARLCLF